MIASKLLRRTVCLSMLRYQVTTDAFHSTHLILSECYARIFRVFDKNFQGKRVEGKVLQYDRSYYQRKTGKQARKLPQRPQPKRSEVC